MEWVKAVDLLVFDDNVSCCDKGNKVLMVCTSVQCRKKQRLVCMKCSRVHQDHSNELIKVKQFIKHSSERHDTTKKVQNYKEDMPTQPVNYVDSIVNNTIAKQKQSFAQQMQEIQQRMSFGVKKVLGQLDAFDRSRENVLKLDKKKGATLETLSTEFLEMVIDLYWKQNKEYDCESDVPQFVEEQMLKCSENIQSLLSDVFQMINQEANKCLSRIKTLIKNDKIEELQKQFDKDDRDKSPPKFPKPRNYSQSQPRPISSKIFSKTTDLQEIENKINQQQDLIIKDIEKLQDNKANLFSENNNLQDLSDKYFQMLADRIQQKKNEIERMEKCKNIQNLKIARNQLNTLIREQVQLYKKMNAQKLRVDNRILEVLKNLEYKEEELQESKVMAQKVSIQRTLQKSIHNFTEMNNDDQTIFSTDDSPTNKTLQITQHGQDQIQKSYASYQSNNLQGYITQQQPSSYSNSIRIQNRKQTQIRNTSSSKQRPDSACNQNIRNKSFYSVGTSFQLGESNQKQSFEKFDNNNKILLKQNINQAYLNNNSNHLYCTTRSALTQQSQTQPSPTKSKRPSTMSSQDSDTTAAFSPVKIIRKVI
ncbi:hypothetical protein TTHERM_00760810 (macronuclear) [Tetrahymena thermophila SB210]|uniref:Uncharacterized protein n=1 Tax=Tetrahymena thermophila (strain SB210) TaxID=312017 RepID=I7M617_TETTS|nr:hypothetical protein TTHERM_00760810 [Tetrahymena thermophila SB210]EAR84034.2 hypothetical protein TTHERM_00760810 [Tetrahymena thermophila SB210]|eukprot:XP_001031697.2 hypothetical protein TTHERM_00760810 [Tetrahymena thermophila SB210]